MKKISLVALIAVMVSFVAVSCKKYEDGPTFSLASKKGRVAGDWKVAKATVVNPDGEYDVTPSFQSVLTHLELTKDGDVKMTYGGDDYTGSWDFDSKKENITISIDGTTTTWKWEILRLKQKELWVNWYFDTQDPEYIRVELEQ